MNGKLKRLIYAFFIMLLSCITFFVGCTNGGSGGTDASGSGKTYTVKFELCTDLMTNRIMDRTVEAGKTVDEPTVAIRGDNPENLEIVGWYQDEAYTTSWDFDFDLVTSDVILYAKWEARYSVDFYLGDNTVPVSTSLIKGGRKAEPCEDKCYGYEVLGYYTSREYTEEFDFEQPITKNTSVYIQVGGQLFYDAVSIENAFAAFAGKGGVGGNPTAGSIVYEEKDGESYARVDFGYSNSADPYIAVEYTDVDITKSQSIEVTFKNLGDAYQLALLWVAKDNYGYVGKSEYSSANSYYYDLGAYRNMSEDDEWATIRINLAELNVNWRASTSLYSLRFQSCYNSYNPTENPNTHCKEETVPNVMLIKSIKGVYDAAYDPDRCLVTYHLRDNVSSERVDRDSKLVRNDAACAGYKVLGYYTDAAYTTPFDFNSVITGDIDIYVKTDDYIYFDATALTAFKAYSPTDGNGSEGSVTLSESGEYVTVDYGYAPALADAHIALVNVQIDKMGCSKLEITMKNLGGAASFAIYWQGVDKAGIAHNGWSASMAAYGGFSLAQRNMSEDSEWITLTIDLSTISGWTDLETLTALRIESNYRATSESDLTNVWLIKEIKGVA